MPRTACRSAVDLRTAALRAGVVLTIVASLFVFALRAAAA
jgi:hypothetical protein